MDFESIWEASFFLLTAAYYVMRLYAVTFSLEHGNYHNQLQAFKADLDEKDRNLVSQLNQHLPS